MAKGLLADCRLGHEAIGNHPSRQISSGTVGFVESNCLVDGPSDAACRPGRSMYHDQALIPVKALHFEEAVNVTLGLPIVRTAPDHGTAFDIAGQDRADPRPMAAAIRMVIGLTTIPLSNLFTWRTAAACCSIERFR